MSAVHKIATNVVKTW